MKRADFARGLQEIAALAQTLTTNCRALAEGMDSAPDLAADLRRIRNVHNAMGHELNTLQRAVGSHPTLEAVRPKR